MKMEYQWSMGVSVNFFCPGKGEGYESAYYYYLYRNKAREILQTGMVYQSITMLELLDGWDRYALKYWLHEGD